MKIIIQQPIEITITKGIKLKYFDYDHQVWKDATVIAINHELSMVTLESENGIQWMENSMLELTNVQSYNWTAFMNVVKK